MMNSKANALNSIAKAMKLGASAINSTANPTNCQWDKHYCKLQVNNSIAKTCKFVARVNITVY